MTTNDDGIDPARDGTGDPLKDDGFTEHRSSEDITDLPGEREKTKTKTVVSVTESTREGLGDVQCRSDSSTSP